VLKMGVQLFEIPLHSKRPKIHDYMTTVKGSWEKSLNSIIYLVKNNANIIPVIVITRLNYHLIEETITFLNELGLRKIMVNRFNIGGNGIKALKELLLIKEELREVFNQVDKLANDYGLFISSNVCTPFCVLNSSDFKNILFGSCSSNLLHRPLTIDINGNLRLCNHSPFIAGNIFKTEIGQIFDSDYAKQWSEVKPSFCFDCELFKQCLGGCRAASEQLNQDLSFVDPILQI